MVFVYATVTFPRLNDEPLTNGVVVLLPKPTVPVIFKLEGLALHSVASKIPSLSSSKSQPSGTPSASASAVSLKPGHISALLITLSPSSSQFGEVTAGSVPLTST